MKKTLLALLLLAGSMSTTFASAPPTSDITFTTSCGTVYHFDSSQGAAEIAEAGMIMDEIDCG